MATISPPVMMPPTTLDLSDTEVKMLSSSLVMVDQALTFVIMDNGMVYGLCHSPKELGEGFTPIMPLHSLLLRFGRPRAGTQVMSRFLVKVADTIWAVREFELWRASQLVYPGLRAYATYLNLLYGFSAVNGLCIQVSTDKDGEISATAIWGDKVYGTIHEVFVIGDWGSGTNVVGRISYEWEGKTKTSEIYFQDVESLSQRGVQLQGFGRRV